MTESTGSAFESVGESNVGGVLGKVGPNGEVQEPEPEAENQEDRWLSEAGVMLLNGLMRIFSSGNVPAEVHVDPTKLAAVRSIDLVEVVGKHVPSGANRESVLQVAQWWNQNRNRLSYTPREGFLFPVVISQSEQVEAEVFSAVLQELQARGLEQAIARLGIDIQTLMKSPKLFQDTVWFQFQFLLHEWLNPSKIVVPGVNGPNVRL